MYYYFIPIWKPVIAGLPGRFEALKEVAEEYAFILDLEGISGQ